MPEYDIILYKKYIYLHSTQKKNHMHEKTGEGHNKGSKRITGGAVLFSAIGILLVVAAISVLIATRLVPVLQVSGKSMEPALENGELVVIKKTTKIKQGDIIGFYYQSKILVKRVIGTAGDYIDIDEDGNVYVNGEKLDEPYAIKKDLGECDIDFPYQVPEGKYFVMGDHRSVSVDSRSSAIGCVAEDQIIGKVAFRFWPLSKMGFLK